MKAQLSFVGANHFSSDPNRFGSFDRDPMVKLFHYVDHWTTVEHEFISPALQESHRIFREMAVKFSHALALKTTTNKNGQATVAPSGHQGGPLPDWAKKEAKEQIYWQQHL